MNKDLDYISLARKYRPTSFVDLVGQDMLVSAFNSAFKKNNIAQSFILYGTRGVGKTSTARLIAKALNCASASAEQGAVICNKCDHCIGISNGSYTDVIELDAASKTGIDDVRNIIDSAHYVPLMGKFKVFIIDEAHMLSNSAFNGLLKILEEPPAHVKFILATTEIQKIPATIFSRTQNFLLKNINKVSMVARLESVCEMESIKADKQALELISDSSEGSMRDALSILDQINLTSDSSVTLENTLSILGYNNSKEIYKLIKALMDKDAEDTLSIANTLYSLGLTPIVIIEYLLKSLHNIMISIALKGKNTQGIYSDYEQSLINSIPSYSLASLNKLWQILLNALEGAKGSLSHQTLNVVLIRILWSGDMQNLRGLVNSLDLSTRESNGNGQSLFHKKDSAAPEHSTQEIKIDSASSAMSDFYASMDEDMDKDIENDISKRFGIDKED